MSDSDPSPGCGQQSSPEVRSSGDPNLFAHLSYFCLSALALVLFVWWVGPGWFVLLIFATIFLFPFSLIAGFVSTRARMSGKRIMSAWGITCAAFLLLFLSGNGCLGWYEARAIRSEADRANRLVVRVVDTQYEFDERAKILYQSSNPDEIQELAQNMSFHPIVLTLPCGCYGDLAFQFYDGDKLISHHVLAHGDALSGMPLSYSSQDFLQEWLLKRDITEKALQEARESMRASDR